MFVLRKHYLVTRLPGGVPARDEATFVRVIRGGQEPSRRRRLAFSAFADHSGITWRRSRKDRFGNYSPSDPWKECRCRAIHALTHINAAAAAHALLHGSVTGGPGRPG
jgi:hypothetical protein